MSTGVWICKWSAHALVSRNNLNLESSPEYCWPIYFWSTANGRYSEYSIDIVIDWSSVLYSIVFFFVYNEIFSDVLVILICSQCISLKMYAILTITFILFNKGRSFFIFPWNITLICKNKDIFYKHESFHTR